jgi:hypothetical protein
VARERELDEQLAAARPKDVGEPEARPPDTRPEVGLPHDAPPAMTVFSELPSSGTDARAAVMRTLQEGAGNAGVRRLMADSALAEEARLQRQPQPKTTPEPPPAAGAGGPKVDSYSISVDLPGETQVRGGWHDVYTERPTTLRATLSKSSLSVNFSPGLIADVTWPASDQAIHGATYDVKTGAISASTSYTQTFALNVGGGSAQSQVSAWMRDVVTGTPLAITPYDFEADANPFDTLRQVVNNMGGGGGGGGIPNSEIKNVTVSANISIPGEIVRQSGAGGIKISGSLTATIRFSGNAETVQDAGKREIQSMEVSGPGIVVTKDGADVARIDRVTVQHGGSVSFGNLEVLHKAGGVESLIRLLGMLAGDPLASRALEAGIITPEMARGLEPAVVRELIRSEINKNLTPALLQALRENRHAVPEIDLVKALGLP